MSDFASTRLRWSIRTEKTSCGFLRRCVKVREKSDRKPAHLRGKILTASIQFQSTEIRGRVAEELRARATELIDLDFSFDNDRVIQRKVSCSDSASAVGARFHAVDGQDQVGTAVNDRRCPIEVRRAIHGPGYAKPCRDAIEITEVRLRLPSTARPADLAAA